MSRTNKDKPKEIRFPKYYKERHERELTKKHIDTDWHWVQHTPSWWNNLFHTAPRRRAAHDWERKIVGLSCDIIILDEIEEEKYLETNKPHKYYW